MVMILSTVIGARLGHCLGYEPGYYLAHPLEILYIWEGGLASHGATVGILLGILYYSSKRKSTGQSYLWTLDRIVIVVALGGSFIRIGNVMNSEIIGKPTDAAQAFMFVHPAQEVIEANFGTYISNIQWNNTDKDSSFNGTPLHKLTLSFDVENGRIQPTAIQNLTQNDIPFLLSSSPVALEHIKIFANKLDAKITPNGAITQCSFNVWAIPRHPAQLYESISTFLLFLLLYFIWNKKKQKTPQGLLFGIFVVVLFTLRILYEFLKENQVAAESKMALNYGQIYSIPLVIAGIIVLIMVARREKQNATI